MLNEIVTSLLQMQPDVDIHVDVTPDDVVPDLIVTSSDVTRTSAVLGIGPDSSTWLELPRGELTRGLIAAAVNAARQRHSSSDWIEVLVAACGRIDRLLEEATAIAYEVYEQDGTFVDWRAAFAEHRMEALEAPLTSGIATPSESLADFLDRVAGGSQLLAGPWPEQHPLGRLITEYRLDGRQLDIMLLAFVHELDPRYGHRYAYLQRDATLQHPTVDLMATLLAVDAADRLAVQRELMSGQLTRTGLIRLTESNAISIDLSVLRMLIGDAEPMAGQLLINPADTARLEASYRSRSEAVDGAAVLGDGLPLHLHGGTAAERRSTAVDVAHLLGERLLVVDHGDDGSGRSRLSEADAQYLRRECIRLGARALIEVSADAADHAVDPLAALADLAITAGDPPAKPSDHTTIGQRRNVEVRPIPVAEREAVWESACRWTGIEITEGRADLSARYGVTVDRAAAALDAADTGEASLPASQVLQALGEATADDAGGLLRITESRVKLDDLVVTDDVRATLDIAVARIRHRDLVISEAGWDQRSSRLTGTYLMFAGQPGTGKTMAGEAVAGELGLPVQHLEISSLLSRWVGDFEAAVDKVFAAAAASGAILLANEADAILSPRTEVDSAQAHYANAGTSHLLSRLESFTGHVIFTSNLVGANNIDPAFHRRLTATIRFAMPDKGERRRLWRSVWPTSTRSGRPLIYRFINTRGGYNGDLLDRLAAEQAISGGSIANIARTATFLAAEELPNLDTGLDPATGDAPGEITITEAHLRQALSIELAKIGDYRGLTQARPPRPRPRGLVRPVLSGTGAQRP